jgi:hypothetical protein
MPALPACQVHRACVVAALSSFVLQGFMAKYQNGSA